MADAIFRVKYTFVQQGDLAGGWTMSFWNKSTDITLVETQARELRSILDQITGSDTKIPAMTIQLVAIKRRTKSIGFPAEAVVVGAPAKPSDLQTSAALLKLSDGGLVNVTMSMRGIPDDVIALGGRLQPAAAGWNLSVPKLRTALAGGPNVATPWVLRVQDNLQLEHTITAIDPTTRLIRAPLHGIAAGDVVLVRVKGVKSPRTYNGQILVQGIDTNQLEVFNAPIDPTLPPAVFNKASLRKVIYTSADIKEVTFVRAMKRDVGRPTLVLTGRRKTRR